jgi:hypothetical protein
LPVATERQIAANRANAKRSTGPKTAAGKRRSSGNAFRHGLSGPLPDDVLTLAAIDAVASAVVGSVDAAAVNTEQMATAFARSQIELRRIRRVRDGMLEGLDRADLDPKDLRRMAALDRYERLARTKRRRAMRLLDQQLHSQR